MVDSTAPPTWALWCGGRAGRDGTKTNATSQTLFGDAGTSVAISNGTVLNASAGALFTVNGQSVHVFDATSLSNGGNQTLTINGSASDLVAINLDGLGNVQFHGGIMLTGGLTFDNVIFNLGGGNYTNHTGAGSLDINNNGGNAGIARGIFLDPNGAMDVTNGVVFGRVFGGDSHDFQYVSGSQISIPEPSSLALLGLGGLAALGGLRPQAKTVKAPKAVMHQEDRRKPLLRWDGGSFPKLREPAASAIAQLPLSAHINREPLILLAVLFSTLYGKSERIDAGHKDCY